MPHVKDIHPALVHKEALEQRLDEDLPLSERQDQRVEPRPAALPDRQQRDLWQVGKEEEDQVDN